MKVEPTIPRTPHGNDVTLNHHDPKKRPRKGILKITTIDESITTKYSGSTPSAVPVTFDNIEVREYSVVIGDNPSCTSGPPVSIGWSYNEGFVIGVEEYETRRQKRRNFLQMAMPRTVREEMLMYEFGFSRSQVAAAIRENVKTKNQRRQTLNNLGNYSKMEEVLESIRRKVRRGICGRKSDLDLMCQDAGWIDRSRRSAEFVAEEIAASQHQSEQELTCKDPLKNSLREVMVHQLDSVTIPAPKSSGSEPSEADKGSEPESLSRRPSGISVTESPSALDEHLEKIKGYHEEIPNMPQQLQQDAHSIFSSQ